MGNNMNENEDTSKESAPPTASIDQNAEFARMYYQHQYDRVAKHEEYRLTVSNISIGASTIAFTFGFSNNHDINLFSGFVLPFAVISVNLFAILYFRRTVDFNRAHRERAKRILEVYAKDIFQIDQAIQWRRGFSRTWNDWRIQVYIHTVFILVSLLPIYLFIHSIIP